MIRPRSAAAAAVLSILSFAALAPAAPAALVRGDVAGPPRAASDGGRVGVPVLRDGRRLTLLIPSRAVVRSGPVDKLAPADLHLGDQVAWRGRARSGRVHASGLRLVRAADGPSFASLRTLLADAVGAGERAGAKAAAASSAEKGQTVGELRAELQDAVAETNGLRARTQVYSASLRQAVAGVRGKRGSGSYVGSLTAAAEGLDTATAALERAVTQLEEQIISLPIEDRTILDGLGNVDLPFSGVGTVSQAIAALTAVLNGQPPL